MHFPVTTFVTLIPSTGVALDNFSTPKILSLYKEFLMNVVVVCLFGCFVLFCFLCESLIYLQGNLWQ